MWKREVAAAGTFQPSLCRGGPCAWHGRDGARGAAEGDRRSGELPVQRSQVTSAGVKAVGMVGAGGPKTYVYPRPQLLRLDFVLPG